MNELTDILGVKLPDGIKIYHATNNSKRVKENSIFFALKGINCHGSKYIDCLLYTSPSPRDGLLSRMPSSA